MCAVALFLALPILSYNRVATDNQVARLESGRVTADKFDWAALRFDFGKPGEAAVARLARSGDAKVRTAAAHALAAKDRYDLRVERETGVAIQAIEQRLRIVPTPTPANAALLRNALVREGECANDSRCVLIVESPTTALLVTQSCANCEAIVQPYAVRNGKWSIGFGPDDMARVGTDGLRDALVQGRVEVRNVTRRQVFVGGRSVGTVLDGPPVAVEVPRPLR